MTSDSSSCITLEPLNAPFPIFAADVSALLPEGWQADIQRAVRDHGFVSELHGESVTSRESLFEPTAVSRLTVVDGEAVHADIPWLFDLYSNQFLDMANGLDLGQFTTSDAVLSAVNINFQQRAERYEWHVDSNPLTGLLFASTLGSADGGELIFRSDPLGLRPAESWELRIQPHAGTLHLYDAREAAHTVEPVKTDHGRLSIPMNYYFAEGTGNRPGDLDQYLYRKP